jgi:nicotinamidase-related amidase
MTTHGTCRHRNHVLCWSDELDERGRAANTGTRHAHRYAPMNRPSTRRTMSGIRGPGGVTSIPVAGTALLLIDVINDMDFEGSEALVAQAESMAVRLAALKRRATGAGVPCIYINDNFGQWRSDFRQTVAHCTSPSSPGRHVSKRLRPTPKDYFVLKPKHSGFFDTTLDTLLGALAIRRVILTGIAGNICVLFTANDAYMRDLKLFVPADCIVSNTPEENDHALEQIATVLKGNLTPSTNLRFRNSRHRSSARTTSSS